MRWLPLLVALSLSACVASPAQAQQGAPAQPSRVCAPSSELMTKLREKYGETPIAFGIHGDGRLLQIFSSPTKGTWTAVAATPQGTSCIVAVGKGWTLSPTLSGQPIGLGE